MTPRRTERDALGIPIGDTSSPVVRQAREQDARNRKARTAMKARAMERRIEEIRQAAIDRMQREERARRDLEEHRRRLADELDREIARTQPNPWLKPWDPGYESPTVIALRHAAEAKPAGPVDANAIARDAGAARRDPAELLQRCPGADACQADCRQEEVPLLCRGSSRVDSREGGCAHTEGA
jgi:hypothetical protein